MPTRENYASEENKCTLFVVILQVKTLIAIVYRSQEKNMQIIINALWTFVIIHNFIWQHFRLQHMVRMQHLMHMYLFSLSINRMLILQLNIFLSVKFMFSLWFFMQSCFYFSFLCCRCSYNINVNYFNCRNSSDVCPTSSKNRILNETLTYQKLNIIKIINYLASLFRVKFYLPTI